MADIDLSAASTEKLLRELSERLVGTELKEEDRQDRWKAPDPLDVVHAVLKLIAQPRLTGGGDWPKLPHERLNEIVRVFDLIRDATLEPDSDGDHVLRLHYEDRSAGYLAAQPMTVPCDFLPAVNDRASRPPMATAVGRGETFVTRRPRPLVGFRSWA